MAKVISPRPSRIYVFAGVQGAGKTSLGGALIQQIGGDYCNPDEVAFRLVAADPTLTQTHVKNAVWHHGVRLLKRAIEERLDFAFETNLGANTVPRLLIQAASRGIEIYVWYVGLSSPKLHIERLVGRLRDRGRDLSAEHIRRRYDRSRLNLIEILPLVSSLRVYDNSADANPADGRTPKPVLVLNMVRGNILNPRQLRLTPDWAKPIVAAAIKLKLG